MLKITQSNLRSLIFYKTWMKPILTLISHLFTKWPIKAQVLSTFIFKATRLQLLKLAIYFVNICLSKMYGCEGVCVFVWKLTIFCRVISRNRVHRSLWNSAWIFAYVFSKTLLILALICRKLSFLGYIVVFS